MTAGILKENEHRRIQRSLGQLVCFVMFCVWQMGIIYYIGPSLNLDGRTPLPIPEENLTALIVSGYVLSIFTMILAPALVIRLCRLCTAAALLCALGLFLPLGTGALALLVYIQCFCCCYMIGFESATMCHYFTQDTVTKHLLIAYPLGYLLVALIQNDVFPLDFAAFRVAMVGMLTLLLLFYCKMPAEGGIRFVTKEDALLAPRRFAAGFLLLAFLGALLGVIAPAAAAEVEHGVSAAYLGCALGSLALYALSRRMGRHPICYVSYIIGLCAIGYVLLVVSEHLPGMGIWACGLIGMGMAVCALLPLFALLLVRQYPSRFVVPAYIALAMLAVVVQAVLVEVFRGDRVLLNLAYLAVVIVMAVLYMLFEPFLLYAMRRDFSLPQPSEPAAAPPEPDCLAGLTRREREVAELIICGHSNADIARALVISEHTVKDHTKNIYRKLELHSRFELTALVTRQRTAR